MLDDVTAALAAIQGEGTFAIELVCPAGDLHLEVTGVGPIPFPIPAATARKLRGVARPAPFGRRDRTLHDTSVRDTWEIEEARIKLDARPWARTSKPQLALLQKGLGLPDEGKLVATLDKLLVYEPGQFFAPHQDSERSADMVGSLVVTLPSASTGGSVVVEHRGEKKVFPCGSRGPDELSLLAFYADCHHEVRPIESGFRVVLTFHLRYRGGPKLPSLPDPAMAVDRLAESVRAYFATPVAKEYSKAPPERPDRLVYLLDHEYTQKSLGWKRLKNADRPRVEALREVADRLECEIFLALADVHESWACEDEYERGGWGRGGYRFEHEDDDEEVESDGGGHTLVELISDDVELRHWVPRSGKAAPSVPMEPERREVCFTRASSELSPFRSEHEGYMGNYGNTVDRWYHRAAVVMWPRERNFVIRARVSPSWAVKEIRARIEAGALKEARDLAHSLLPFWRRSAALEAGEAFFLDLLAALSSLGGKDLACQLLAPMGPHRLTPAAAPLFVALVERHGAPWGKEVFSAWAENVRYDTPPWLASLPGLCEALLAGAKKHGRGLAAWLLEREVASFQKRHEGLLGLPPLVLHEESMRQHRGDIVSLLSAAAVLGAGSVRDGVLAFLMAPGTALPLLQAGELLSECRASGRPASVRAIGLGALYRHVVSSLRSALEAPARSPDDWSIEPSGRCKCALCKELSAFLRAPDRIEHPWPLAKAERAHVHHVIDGERLPVSHVTERRGRPYTLVLKKKDALFEMDAKTRARWRELLAWLAKHHSAFSEPA